MTHPELAKEYSSRNTLPVTQVKVQSNDIFWWKCSKPGCGHEWQSAMYYRVRGKSKCPACSGRVPTEKNNLAVKYPSRAREYSSRNSLPATQVLPSTHQKLWWKCSKPECGHEWQASGNLRAQRGCPECSKRRRNKLPNK